MEIKDLKLLIKMMTDTDISEFRMETKDEKIVIKRGPEKEYVQMATSYAAPQNIITAPAAAASAPAMAAGPAVATVDERYETILSPIVGTMYQKPAPDAAKFVKAGDVVEVGQTLCLVEAMKLFNEIEAEFKCRIIEILKDDATPVEYGEALFLVERL
ncbi:acetyl-CoA carboxylase biotin carboxyl carrier protein [Geopsychrobacter electrodiphilus]|uniref:acetyl-CoA carboxylase biotin carboxyl carrier protein n=1 Tax=Geopsychrobacter electrodiphilus TaxID=225196 RepID=UPI00037864EA|nr:acetyl-CoA carboxylase biotin carboxyl carrier protein [Geopsychrobacter electrodiphilus]